MIRSRDSWVKTNRWIAGFLTLFTLALVSVAQGVDQVTYYHNDALGSPVAATDASGAVIWRESYLPHGKRRTYAARETTCQGSNCTPVETQGDEKLWYTGKFEETSVGLLYLGARWYDPDLGRFLSVDPVSYTPASYESFNRYAYANNNPYRFVDPNGRSAVTAIGGLMYETGQWVQGNGFDGQSVLGALADGYNGEGDGFAAAAFVDATSLVPGGAAVKAISALRGLRIASQAAGVANNAGGVGKTVLGHFPEYKNLAESMGARRFNIPESVWNKMSEAERGGANRKFLDRMISRGDDVILATPLNKVRPGSYFAKELEYLSGKGYRPSADGSRLIRGD